MPKKVWKLTVHFANHDVKYELGEITWTTYKGGAANAAFWHEGKYCSEKGLGCFPVKEFVKLERIQD